MTAESTRSAARRKATAEKPDRPKGSPLFPHASKRWCHKFHGQFYYYGSWEAGHAAALDEYHRCKDYDLAGKPRPPKDGTPGATVRFVVDKFLTKKERMRDAGEIQPRTFDEFFAAGVVVADAFGRNHQVSHLTPDDFGKLRAQLAKKWGPVPLANLIVRIRSIFKHAFVNGDIPAPARFGDEFSKPSSKVLKLHKASRGRMDLQAEEIRTLVDAADVHLKAMIYLGINAAFGNHDCGMLPRSAVDLTGGWVEFPRPKTGEQRRAKLWPETVKALETSLAKRPTPKDPDAGDLVFITKYGNGWGKMKAGNAPICQKFRKLLLAAGLHRPGIGFYSLRRSFRTIAGQTLDEMACDLVMGHGAADDDMGKRYTQFIGDDRLERVAEHVRIWLFAKPVNAGKGKAKAK